MKKTVKKRTVFEKEISKVFINSENAVAMLNVNQFEGHTGRAFHGIFVPASRTKPAVTSERYKFKISTMRAAVHGTAESGIATVNHLIDIFHLRISGMKSIFNFFIIVGKNLLKYIHKTIMKENGRKRKP